MNPTYFLACFLAYVVGLIAFGCWVSRRKQDGEDFLLGGRSVPLFLTLGTTVATMVGTGSSMGAVGKAYTNGWMGGLFCVGGALGIFLLAKLFAPVRQYQFVSIAEEIESYVGGSKLVNRVIAVFAFLTCVGWLGAHIMGGAAYLSYVTGTSPYLAKTIVALGFGIYAVIGGYRAVIWTDTIQAVILFIGFAFTTAFAFQATGGWQGLQEVNQAIQQEKGSNLALPSLSLVVGIAVGVLGTPAFRQRIYSGKSVRDVQRAFFSSGVLYLGFAICPTVIGIAAFHANPALNDSDHAFPWMATSVLPTAMGALILLSGLSATMSSASSDAIAGVTTIVRDLYQMVTGKLPHPDKVVLISRTALTATSLLALCFALFADTIISFITSMISLFIVGTAVAGVLGRIWPRYNAAGAIASITGAFLTSSAFLIQANIHSDQNWLSFWGNPVLPSLFVSIALGIVVSLITRPDRMTQQEVLERLSRERKEMES